MTTDDVKKIRADMRPGHHILTNDVVEAIDWLADALREAQAQTVQMREVVRQDHCDYGDACVLHKMKEVVSTLPAPAARTYDDAIRDAAKAIRDQAIRTFGKPTTVANGYAEVVESLLSPAPAVAPVAQKTVRTSTCCLGPMIRPGGCAFDYGGTCDRPKWTDAVAPVAAPRPLHPADCAHDSTPEVSVPHMPDSCGFVSDTNHVACPLPFGHAGWHQTPPVAAPKPGPTTDVKFDAEAALVAMEHSIAQRQHGPTPATRYEVYTAIQDALAAGRGAR